MHRKKSLVIAPHSDDAELGLGGYIHRESEKGAEFAVVVLASGGNSHSKFRERARGEVRQAEGVAAGRVLGVKDYAFVSVADDGKFEQTPQSTIVAALERLIFSQVWDELFIPLPSFHGDHRVAYEASIAALRPHLNRTFPAAVYAYEYPGNVWGPPVPEAGKVYAVLDPENLQAKIDAIAEHKSQWVSNPDSLWGARGVKALAELRGTEISVQAAERFYLVRQVLQ